MPPHRQFVLGTHASADQDRIEAWEPNLLILAGAPIVSKETIAMAKVACLNPHRGIMPDYCGSSPVDWAIYERRFDDVGYTVHVVVPAVEAGPIIHQERVASDPIRLPHAEDFDGDVRQDDRESRASRPRRAHPGHAAGQSPVDATGGPFRPSSRRAPSSAIRQTSSPPRQGFR